MTAAGGITGGRPSVLFVCVKNGGKSQMAAGIMRHAVGEAIDIDSAGTRPGDAVNPVSAQTLEEWGIDISAEVPKAVTPELVRTATGVFRSRRHRRPRPRSAFRDLGHRRTLRTRDRRDRTDAPDPRRHRRPGRDSHAAAPALSLNPRGTGGRFSVSRIQGSGLQ